MSTQSTQLERYGGGETDDYSSDSDVYSDNISESGSENCSDYGSDYESDTETSIINPQISQPPKVEEQMSNSTNFTDRVGVIYTQRQEKFDNKFTQKDLLNRICGIASSPAREMLSTKGLLEDVYLWDYLLPNYGAKEGISLLDAYTREELADKLVIQVEQGEYKKFSVVDDISEVYGLPGIHECINGQRPLRPVIDIDASSEKMGLEKVNARDVFIHNGWNNLNDTRVQPPISMNFEVRPRILSVEKINQKKIIVGHNALKNYANLVLRKYPNYLSDWDIEERSSCQGIEKNSQYFVYFSRKAYQECPICNRIHEKDQRWFGRVYGNGSFVVKCFQQNRDERGVIFNDPSIAEKIQQKNKNNIPSPVIHKVKGPKFPWPFLEMPAWAKCDSPLTATEVYEEQYVKPLPEEGDVYVGSPWETGKTYTLEHLTIPEAINLLALSTRHSYSSAVTVRLNLKSYCDIDTKIINLPEHQRVVYEVVSINDQAHTRLAGRSREHLYKLIHEARRIIVMDNDLTDLNIEWIKSLRKGKQFSVIHNTYQPQKDKKFRLAPNKETVLAELWEWARVMSSLPYEERKSASLICHLRGDVQGITRALIREFPTLRIKRYHGKSDQIEKSHDFSNVEETWKDVDLVAYTSTLKIGVSCTNPKFERAFCLFKSYIETNAGTNQMLFRMRCIKEYTCHIEQRSSNLPITEEGLFHWLLKAKRESLPQELQNRGIFPDVESIIRNKDIPTVRLWVAHTLEKFRSRRLFGWRMVDFLKKAGMVVSIIKATPKAKDDTVTLTETVKGYSSAIKAEEISDIANANILNHEMAEHLENKPKKTLEEMYALSRYHIADCYNMSSGSITEDFISGYGKYDHMKWFRSYKQLRDAGTDNETAVEAIVRKDYREYRLTTTTRAEKHRICLELLKTCTPVKDIDDRNRYKAGIVKSCLESPESIKFLQGLVPKMARVFDNTDSSRRAKKSGLKTLRSKLGLLNSALYATYGLKFKATDKSLRYYHLVGVFDKENAPKLPAYQTGEGQFYENGEDIRYGYSKLSPDELEIAPSSDI
ncbi:9945_t:CDS:2 [Paraglomus occultum]|uniref:9945_t:CDS:1 n=1 Tax=Paraglomus occultum TaxID=144539 RepID=A0A9N9GLQ5_9GLOM|nr:9945_t:CDS:2 [Paraglomus occultum]